MAVQKRLFALLFAATLPCIICLPVFAHDVVDTSRQGSVTIAMRSGEKIVPGGTLTCYRVGNVWEDDGNFSYFLTSEFAGCGESLEDVQSAELAKRLAQYARDNGRKRTTKRIDENGTVSFDNLAVGLYLFVQNRAAAGYLKTDPFLVRVPMMEAEVYVYDVYASPKAEVKKEPAAPPTAPTGPKGPTLPQTGQLNWPAPLLVILGLSFSPSDGYCALGKRRMVDRAPQKSCPFALWPDLFAQTS
ncbi:MAG: hypothetical protein ACI3V5_06060 [Faecousia sp.]